MYPVPDSSIAIPHPFKHLFRLNYEATLSYKINKNWQFNGLFFLVFISESFAIYVLSQTGVLLIFVYGLIGNA